MQQALAGGSEQQQRPSPKCPRCGSLNTKFCYYNNYSVTQPRYLCKTCRRYWTLGGTLRNVPVGGGSRNRKGDNASSSGESPRAERPQGQQSSGAGRQNTIPIALAGLNSRLETPGNSNLAGGWTSLSVSRMVSYSPVNRPQGLNQPLNPTPDLDSGVLRGSQIMDLSPGFGNLAVNPRPQYQPPQLHQEELVQPSNVFVGSSASQQDWAQGFNNVPNFVAHDPLPWSPMTATSSGANIISESTSEFGLSQHRPGYGHP